jgi:hypothetical protein
MKTTRRRDAGLDKPGELAAGWVDKWVSRRYIDFNRLAELEEKEVIANETQFNMLGRW